MRTCLLILVLVLVSCSEDGEAGAANPSLLIGSWQYQGFEEASGWDQVTEYSFETGNTVVRSSFVKDHTTGNLLGYNQVASGTYTTQGDQLLLDYTEIRQNNSTNPYMDRELMLITGYSFTDQFTFLINNAGNSLTLITYCAPGTNCPEGMVFQRH